jgi:hypothetical protein
MLDHFRRHGFLASLSPLALLSLAACAHSQDPVRVSLAQIGNGGLTRWTGKAPLIVEFQAGDHLPIHMELSSEDFVLEPSTPPLELVARRHCFVRFDGHDIRTSSDGQSFDEPKQPGSFRIGLNAAPGVPPRFDIIVHAARH